MSTTFGHNRATYAKPNQLLYLRQRMNAGQHNLNGELRTSASGVPHIVVTHNGTTHSICWFQSTHEYRIFTPYPAEKQNRYNFKRVEDVIEFIEGWCNKETKA